MGTCRAPEMHLSVETVAVAAGLDDGSPLTVAFQSETGRGVGGFGTLLGACVKLFMLFYVY